MNDRIKELKELVANNEWLSWAHQNIQVDDGCVRVLFRINDVDGDDYILDPTTWIGKKNLSACKFIGEIATKIERCLDES